MRTLHLVHHALPLADGYAIRTRYLLQAQRQAGSEPIVVTRPGFADTHAPSASFCDVIEGVPQYHFIDDEYPLVRLAKQLPRGLEFARRRSSAAYYRRVAQKSLPFHCLHLHMQPDQFRYVSPLRKAYGVPLIYEVRGVWEDSAVACGELEPSSKQYRDLHETSTRAAMGADRVIAISEGLRKDFIARGIPSDKITVVPNGVDSTFFQPAPRDQDIVGKLGLHGKTVLGYISSIRKLEGLEHLIRAMPEILGAVPDCVCLIVGDGEDRPRLQSLTESLGLQGKVILTGRVPHAQILGYYSVIDIFVVPRSNQRVNNIVTPLKPLEAMSMEKALLVSDVGGLTELVNDGETGLVFEPENPSDLARKAILLATTEALRKELGDRARRRVVQELDWRVVARKSADAARSIVPSADWALPEVRRT